MASIFFAMHFDKEAFGFTIGLETELIRIFCFSPNLGRVDGMAQDEGCGDMDEGEEVSLCLLAA
jgi:hypothetical protein